MKKLIALLTVVSVVSAYSQTGGTVNFQNRNTAVTPNINAPVTYGTDPTGQPGPQVPGTRVNGDLAAAPVLANGFDYSGKHARAGLYGAPVTLPENDLILLVPSVGFRTGAAAGYVNVGSTAARAFPLSGPYAVLPGAEAWVQIRAWDAGAAGVETYEAANALIAANHGVYLGGSSPVLRVTTGGAGTPPGPAADLFGLQPFAMTYYVPEPSIIGLGILGAVAGLFVFRRRN